MPSKPWLLAGITALLLGALSLFYWLGLTSIVGTVHDDVVYLVTGKALAEGMNYRIISHPAAPIQTAYPPLYPAFLAVIWAILPSFPENLWAFKAFNIVCALAGVLLTYHLVTRVYQAPKWQGWLTAGLLAVGSFYVTFMDLTMSEPVFLVCLLLALIGLERLPDSRLLGARWTPVAIGLLAALPSMARSVGLTLAVAVVAWLLVRRQWKLAVTSAAAAALFNMPWLAWAWWGEQLGSESWDYVSWVGGSTDGFSLSAILGHAAHNAVTLVTTSLPLAVAPLVQHAHLTGLLGRLGLAGLQPWLAVAMTLVIGLGVARTLGQRLRLLHVFLAAYLALIIVYPWDPSRFVLVLSPLLIFLFVQGACWAAESWRSPAPRRLAIALAAGLLLTSAGAGLARAGSFVRHQTYHDALLPEPVRVRQADEQALVDWAKAHVPEDGIWLHHRDPL
ncbi:MAG: ArnT family glycosyltransferase, partial [Candidatus Sericytochromatia bacterium]